MNPIENLGKASNMTSGKRSDEVLPVMQLRLDRKGRCRSECGRADRIPRSAGVHVASGTPVAIKRITPFTHVMFGQRTLREIKLLRHFR